MCVSKAWERGVLWVCWAEVARELREVVWV